MFYNGALRVSSNVSDFQLSTNGWMLKLTNNKVIVRKNEGLIISFP